MSNNQRKDTLLSVLNLSPVVQGGTIAESFRNSMDLARWAEEWGYHRYWLAEHHNIEGVASSATAVLIGHIAGGTKKIRVGSGGIMLPNHSSLVIAEQFGTLETLYPGRIDLGLGRAPGTDQLTARALRRNINSGEDFPEQLEELRNYFKPSGNVRNQVRAIPGEGIDVPIWLLLKRLQRPSGWRTWSSVCVCGPFLTGEYGSRFGAVPQFLRAVRRARRTVCDGRCHHYRGRYKRESAAPCDFALSKVS